MIEPNEVNVHPKEKFRFKPQEGSALKQIREALGVSQEEFARRIGVTVSSVSRWERGKNPATFTVPQMKKFLREIRSIGIELDDLPDEMGGAAFKG